jgi:hypothetical protein
LLGVSSLPEDRPLNYRTAFIVALSLASAGAVAQDRPGIPVGVDVGVFFPSSGTVKDTFGDTWFRVGITPVAVQRPENWRFAFDVAFMRTRNDGQRASLIPVTFGITRAFGKLTDGVRPYVALRGGPYWGDVDSPILGIDKSKVGFDANVAVGLTFGGRFYVEARYDHFSDFQGLDFSGFFISAGVKLFDFRL